MILKFKEYLETPQQQTKSMSLGSATPSAVTPDAGYILSSVSPSIDTTVIKAENIAQGVQILGITGTHSGGVTPSGNIELQQQSGTDVTNYATASVKSGSATTPATTIAQSTPTVTGAVSGTNYVVTASVAQKTQDVTPTISSGWVSSGTAGTITLSASSGTLNIPCYTDLS